MSEVKTNNASAAAAVVGIYVGHYGCSAAAPVDGNSYPWVRHYYCRYFVYSYCCIQLYWGHRVPKPLSDVKVNNTKYKHKVCPGAGNAYTTAVSCVSRHKILCKEEGIPNISKQERGQSIVTPAAGEISTVFTMYFT